MKEEIKTFSGEGKLRDYIDSRPSLKEWPKKKKILETE